MAYLGSIDINNPTPSKQGVGGSSPPGPTREDRTIVLSCGPLSFSAQIDVGWLEKASRILTRRGRRQW